MYAMLSGVVCPVFLCVRLSFVACVVDVMRFQDVDRKHTEDIPHEMARWIIFILRRRKKCLTLIRLRSCGNQEHKERERHVKKNILLDHTQLPKY